MENESRKKLDSKTRPFAGLIGCHEEKREAYTRLYKRQVMPFVRVIFSKPVIIKKKDRKDEIFDSNNKEERGEDLPGCPSYTGPDFDVASCLGF